MEQQYCPKKKCEYDDISKAGVHFCILPFCMYKIRIYEPMLKRSTKFKRIGEKLINELPELSYIKDSEVKIAYLESDEEKVKDRKTVFADCTKVNKSRYDWCCHYDFMITVYVPNCELYDFNHDKYKTLIRHELHHIGIDDEGDEPKYYIIPHDVEEFWDIINDKGLDWQEK